MTTTDCDLWNDLLSSPLSFGERDAAQLDALASHVDACPHCRARAATMPPQADLFAILARDSTGHTYDAEFEHDLEALITEQQQDTATAVTDVLYPAFRGTSSAAQTEQVRAALASHPQPELALWRSIDAVALLVRRYAHQERPPRQWLRSDGAIDLGDGNEIPVTTLAAEMARSAGIDRATAHLIAGWLPDAVRRVPTLFRGLEATPIAGHDAQPPMALQLMPRDNLEPLTVRWQPAPSAIEVEERARELQALVATLLRRRTTVEAARGQTLARATGALEDFLVSQAGSADRGQHVRFALTVAEQVGDRAESAAERRHLIAKMEESKAALEDVIRILTIDAELRHEQSGQW